MSTEVPGRLRVPWADVDSLAGRTFSSEWMSVSARRRGLFETASYVDENEFRLADFPADLVEGFHLLSLLDHLSNGVLSVNDAAWSGLNYGFDRVRFVSPVRVGDRLRLVGRVSAVTPKGAGRLVALQCTLEVEGRERPAVVADWIVYWTAGD